MKHTPGPWKVEKISGTIMGVCTETKVKGGMYSIGICEAYWKDVEDYKENKEQIKADMTLIASAPEMLNICVAFNEMLANGTATIIAKEGHESEIAQLFRDNMDIINKATGK